MKLSKFTSLSYHNGEAILFNSESDSLVILDPSLENVYKEHESNPSELEHLHPEFFNVLKSNRFIVPYDDNEGETLIKKWEIMDNDPSHFGIIINPTLNCNLRCWYCYEAHKETQIMTQSTRNKLYNLIENKTADTRLKMLNVSFFGGEPLLLFKENILPVLRFATSICNSKGIAIYSNFTTNGVLLSDEVLETLNSLQLSEKPTFQITLDGNREAHNLIRVGVNKKPTYDTILTNIRGALQRGNMVFVRFNYTYDNISTFNDVLDDFIKYDLIKYVNNLFIKFEHVWQDKDNLPMSKPLMRKIREEFEAKGFTINTDDVYYRHTCYADSPCHVVVNFNGDIFKCTARNFNKEEREGYLRDDGQICWNEKFKNRMEVKFKNVACRNCCILPICNGGCTQSKLDVNNLESCYKGMTEDDKHVYLQAHIQEIISKRQKTTNHDR